MYPRPKLCCFCLLSSAGVRPETAVERHRAAEALPGRHHHGFPEPAGVVSTRAIDWELIKQQYDQMVKYATAVRLGTADAEAILSRFTRLNSQHPTYKAFLELGKVTRTIFLCEYLSSER